MAFSTKMTTSRLTGLLAPARREGAASSAGPEAGVQRGVRRDFSDPRLNSHKPGKSESSIRSLARQSGDRLKAMTSSSKSRMRDQLMQREARADEILKTSQGQDFLQACALENEITDVLRLADEVGQQAGTRAISTESARLQDIDSALKSMVAQAIMGTRLTERGLEGIGVDRSLMSDLKLRAKETPASGLLAIELDSQRQALEAMKAAMG